jgi:hypothetical protein
MPSWVGPLMLLGKNFFVSFGCDGQYGRKHDISNRPGLVAQDMEWV